MTRARRAASHRALLLVVLPLAACPGGQGQGEEALGQTSDTSSADTGESGSGTQGEAETSTTTTSETSSESTTSSESSDTSSGGTSSESSDTSSGGTSSESSDTSSGDTSSGELPPGVEEACMVACMTIGDCVVIPPGCVEACIDNHLGLDAPCFEAELALTTCIGTMTCAEVMQFLADGPNPCEDVLAGVC